MKKISIAEEGLYIEKKSKFICHLFPVSNQDEITEILKAEKKKYFDARHHCYAYILGDDGNDYKCSDDGEPSGTAGMPILNVLENNKLNHILAIVVRYFGGTKLGAGGLVRAYTNSITNTLNNSNIVELIEGCKVKIEFKYDNIKQIDYILNDYNIIDRKYDTNITYIIEIPNNDDIKTKLNNLIINYTIIDNVYIIK